MTRTDEDILLTDSMRQKKMAQADPERGAAERQAHREHLKRMKQYKKKKRRKIIGLVLECVLLLVVCVGLWGINFVDKAFARVTESTNNAANTLLPELEPVVPGSASLVVENADGSTEVYYYTVPETEEQTVATDASGDVISPDDVTAPVRTGYSTFAIFGVDSRDSQTLEQWTQGDVVIIVSLNNETKEVRLCSVFRDFAFESNTDGGLDKITDSYSRYGVRHTVEAMNRNFDLNIEDYVVVNWTAVADVIDALDGIDMYLTAAEAEAMGYYVYETQVATHRKYTVKGIPKGADGAYHDDTYHLNGGQALSVARIRKGVGDDYARTARQRTIINLALQKAQTMNLTQLYTIINTVLDNVRISFEKMEVFSLAKDVFKYQISDTSGFPFNRIVFPVATSMIYADTMVSNVTQLHEFLYGDESYSPSSNVKRIDAYQQQAIEYMRSHQ